MATKTPSAPEISGLLSKISSKRTEYPPAPLQSVQPVLEEKSIAGNTAKSGKGNTGKSTKIGKPTVKSDGVEYIKISPRIRKALKKQMDIALAEERFSDDKGRLIKTIDEFVAFAIEKLIASKK
jgi:hypothetical protein